MISPSYSVEILEFVIDKCSFKELITVSIAIKDELDFYEVNDIKYLFKLIKNRYSIILSGQEENLDYFVTGALD